MNEEQLRLARELAGHPKFKWQAGMLARERSPTGNWQPGDYEWRIVDGEPDLSAVTSEGDLHEAPNMPVGFVWAHPDLTDDATGGVLLGMLDDGHVAMGPEKVQRGSAPAERLWIVKTYVAPGALGAPYCLGVTLAEACARVLLAVWAREVTP